MQLLSEGRKGSDEIERITFASIKCIDLGMDCSFEVKGTTEREIIRQLIEHIESEHNIPVLTADTLFRIKKRLKKICFEGNLLDEKL
jgi:predicted small metal-binding protein